MAENEAEFIHNDKTLYNRFWSKVDKRGPDDCWLWTAGTRAGRYGNIRVGGKKGPMLAAHRIQLIWCGHNMDGKVTLHSCDNGLCVNPKHLKPGTQLENNQDMMQKGRFVPSKGDKNGNSILSNEEVYKIKTKLAENIDVKQISQEMNVEYDVIYNIASGKTYNSIANEILYDKPKRRKGEDHQSAKHTFDFVAKCRILYLELKSFTEVSKIVGISSSSVAKLVKGERWEGEVNGVAPITERLGPVQQIGRRLLTEDQVLKIRDLRGKMTAAAIGEIYNISGALVYAIWHKRAYQFIK